MTEHKEDHKHADFEKAKTSEIRSLLIDYFQLNQNLNQLIENWKKSDSSFEKFSSKFGGLRLLRQHPCECVFSFICSQNNNIKRNTQMLKKLRTKYGQLVIDFALQDIQLIQLESETTNTTSTSNNQQQNINQQNIKQENIKQENNKQPITNLKSLLEDISPPDEKFFSFPTIATLAKKCDENSLREMGFGYRAKYVVEAANQILQKEIEFQKDNLKPTIKNENNKNQNNQNNQNDHGNNKNENNGDETNEKNEWLFSLRNEKREKVQKELTQLMGVGRKVGDCIALFSLDKFDVIPGLFLFLFFVFIFYFHQRCKLAQIVCLYSYCLFCFEIQKYLIITYI